MVSDNGGNELLVCRVASDKVTNGFWRAFIDLLVCRMLPDKGWRAGKYCRMVADKIVIEILLSRNL